MYRNVFRYHLSLISRGRNITTSASPVNMNGRVLRKLFAGKLVKDLEGVGAKVVTLGLEQVSRQTSTAVTIVKGQSRGKGRGGDTPFGSSGHDVSPAVLGLVDGLVEEGVEEQILEVGVLTVSLGDLTQEDRADNAATSPHEGNASIVESPAVLLTSLTDEHETLSVGDNLGGVESLLKLVDKLLLVASERERRARKNLGSSNTLILNGRESSGENSLTNKSNGGGQVKCVDSSPLTSTLLAGGIKNLLHERSSIVIVEVEDITGNLNQEGVQNTLIPLGKDVGDLLVSKAGTSLEQVVRLANELHVTILNTVVDHLDVVAGTSGSDPVATGLTVSLSGNVLENGLDMGPSLRGTTRHERRTGTGTLFTTRDTGANKQNALLLQLVVTTVSVGEVRVTAINDDVTLLKVGLELGNEVVDSVTSLDEQNNAAGSLELVNELLDGVGTKNALALGLVFEEMINLGNSSVVGNNGVSMISSI